MTASGRRYDGTGITAPGLFDDGLEASALWIEGRQTGLDAIQIGRKRRRRGQGAWIECLVLAVEVRRDQLGVLVADIEDDDVAHRSEDGRKQRAIDAGGELGGKADLQSELAQLSQHRDVDVRAVDLEVVGEEGGRPGIAHQRVAEGGGED